MVIAAGAGLRAGAVDMAVLASQATIRYGMCHNARHTADAPIQVSGARFAPAESISPPTQINAIRRERKTRTGRPLFARQPIFRRDLSVAGYELLFRETEQSLAAPAQFDPDRATNEVLLSAFTDQTIQDVCNGKPAFINMTRERLRGPMPFAPHHVVLELLETVVWEAALARELRLLKQQGYRLALDDFVISQLGSPLLELADIVKVEYPACPEDQLAELVIELKRYDVQVLAEKLETPADLHHCMAAGFDLFQGFFLAHPEIVRGQRLPNNRMSVLRLMAALNTPYMELADISTLIQQDAFLSFRLLRVVNALPWRRPNEVTSVKTAVMLLGLDRIQALTAMVALGRLEDKPHALQKLALSRARFAELLAERSRLPSGDSAFTAGLFSCLDAFFDLDMDALLTHIPLHKGLRAALLHHSGPLGWVLQTLLCHEKADWESIPWPTLEAHGITTTELAIDYQESIQWSEAVFRASGI